jgi:hypothetical protein
MPRAEHRKVGVFLHSWCDAGYNVVLVIVALAKTVTPGGSARREPGQAAPPTTKLSSLARRFSRCGKANDIYRPVVRCAIDHNKFFYTNVQLSWFQEYL